ncbi:hypothetical protein V8C86DRAFT_2450273 [Haematococcus lacustris]
MLGASGIRPSPAAQQSADRAMPIMALRPRLLPSRPQGRSITAASSTHPLAAAAAAESPPQGSSETLPPPHHAPLPPHPLPLAVAPSVPSSAAVGVEGWGEVEAVLRRGWDPEGLFGGAGAQLVSPPPESPAARQPPGASQLSGGAVSSTGHHMDMFARRQAAKAAAAAATAAAAAEAAAAATPAHAVLTVAPAAAAAAAAAAEARTTTATAAAGGSVEVEGGAARRGQSEQRALEPLPAQQPNDPAAAPSPHSPAPQPRPALVQGSTAQGHTQRLGPAPASQPAVWPPPLQPLLPCSTTTPGPAEHEAAPALAPAAPPQQPLLSPPWRGVAAACDAPDRGYSRAALQQLLAVRFLAVDLDFPGLQVLHLDPPVLAAPGFASPEECRQLVAAAAASGALAASKIGAGNAGGETSNAYDARRTSSSLLMDAATQDRFPALARCVRRVQQRGLQLLAAGDGRQWGRPGRMPAAGQLCYESPQVARYEAAQHFLSHEDAFPLRLARANGFQRRATLLLYLNDVPEGGATQFDHLGPLSVQPEEGKLLLFFPGFADGRPDPRTLHTASDAIHTKWVMQQWVAGGVAPTQQPMPLALPPLTAPNASPAIMAGRDAPPAPAAHNTSFAVRVPVALPDNAAQARPAAGQKRSKGKKTGKGFGSR